MENNKNKKSVKFQGDMLNFCDFIQVFVFTRNHHLNKPLLYVEGRCLLNIGQFILKMLLWDIYCGLFRQGLLIKGGHIKVNGYTFRGSNSVIFIIASHNNWGHLIKERICSHWSKFFPL